MMSLEISEGRGEGNAGAVAAPGNDEGTKTVISAPNISLN